MTIQDLGSLGELVAALATIATLIYLAMQIRHNTVSVRASTYQALVESYSDFSLLVGRDPETARIFQLGLVRSPDISESDQFRFNMIMLGAARRWENAFYQHARGFVDPDHWQTTELHLARIMSWPGVLRCWSEAKPFYSDRFVEFVDRHISGAPAA